jgi:D-alanine-D-alanine ligase
MGGRYSMHIATEKVKQDIANQKRVGIVDRPADDLAREIASPIQRKEIRALIHR